MTCYQNLTLGWYLQSQFNCQKNIWRLILSNYFKLSIIWVNNNKLKWSVNSSDGWFFALVCGVDGAFKSSVEKLIPYLIFFLKKTKSMWYDVVQSYELLILSDTTFCSTQEDGDELVFQISTYVLVLLGGLDIDLVLDELKGLIMLKTVLTCLDFSLLLSSKVFW